MFLKLLYDIRPIQKPAEWPGVLEPGSMWAFPKEGSYKKKLLEMKKNYGVHLARAKKLQPFVLAKHSEKNVRADYIRAIQAALSGNITATVNAPSDDAIGALV